jgi:Mn2+/Fe2+ NRAMP family transporter
MYAPAPLRRLNRSGLLLLGPAFVAAVAYVDPGDFAAARRTGICCAESWSQPT